MNIYILCRYKTSFLRPGHNGPYSLLIRASFYFVFRSHSIFLRTIYQLQMALGVWHFWNFSYFNVLYKSYRVNNKVIDVPYILMYCYTGILFVVLCEWWVSYTNLFAGNLMCTNDQGLTNLYGNVVFNIQHRLVLFLGSSKPQAGSFNR